MIAAHGLVELVSEFEGKASKIYGETMAVLWDAADEGAAIASASVPRSGRRHSDGDIATADSISPATYGYPWRTRQGVRAVWGPTTKAGRLLSTGTSKLPPNPYLENSLEQVAGRATSRLEAIAGRL